MPYNIAKHQVAAVAFDVSKTIWLNTALNFLEFRAQMEEQHMGDINVTWEVSKIMQGLWTLVRRYTDNATFANPCISLHMLSIILA